MGVTAPPDRELARTYRDLAGAVRDAASVVAVGGGTHAEIGGPVHDATPVRAPSGVVDLQPADMTVTVAAGTTVAELSQALAAHGQECPLDPRDSQATVGGVLAVGLSGIRRLGLGPVRDTLLEVVLVLADGRVVRGGGPTVKNVTGYDLPRLVVGSLGTLGVLAQVTLRTRPRPTAADWLVSDAGPSELRSALASPSAIVTDGCRTWVLLEGDPTDVAAETAAASLTTAEAPVLPVGAHRGRISVAPGAVASTLDALRTQPGLRILGEVGVGTIHVGTDRAAALRDARDVVTDHGGWMLREAGAPELDPFGTEVPAVALQRRLRAALDPGGKLAPGRVPATEPG